MKISKFLHKQKTKIRMKRYKSLINSIGKGCYFDGNIHFGGCKKALIIGNNVTIGPNATFHIQKYNGDAKVTIGNNVFINRGFFLDCNESNIFIGEYCTIGCDVTFLGTNHDINDVEGNYAKLIDKPITLGGGCWLGTRVIVLPGVTLGKGCIVGAGSIVTKSFPDYCMLAGNPAKIIKRYDLNKKEWIKQTN